MPLFNDRSQYRCKYASNKKKSCIICIPTFLDTTLPFVYNYKPANFEEDFISALTALVTAQDDPQRLKELTKGAKDILNDYKNELPNVLTQVKLIYIY